MKMNHNQANAPDRRNIQDILALTPMQEGMFVDYLRTPGSSRYVEQLSLGLIGPIHRQTVEKAWNVVINTNEMLRAVFRWEKIKEPVQVILKAQPVDLKYYDLTGLDTDEQKKLLEETRAEDKAKAFDLRQVPFRVTLCQTGKNKAEMIISNHHILYDGWSNGIILKEFLDAYHGILTQREPQKINKNKFKNFLGWLRTHGNREKQEEFWKRYLSGDSRQYLDVDRPGPAQNRRREKDIRDVGRYRFPFPDKLSERLLSFAREHKITLSSLLTAGWGLVLREYHDTGDIIFDTTVSGRSAKVEGIEHMVGMFINTLPLRVRIRAGETTVDFLTRLQVESREREEYENTPLADINEYLETYSPYSTETWFDSVLILENYPLERQLLQGKGQLSVESFSISGMTHYDLTLIITIFEGIELDITYNSDCFSQDITAQLVRHFTAILEEMLERPHQVAADLEILSGAEKRKIREYFLSLQKSEAAREPLYIGPRDRVEEKLALVWSEVLKKEKSQIGIDADFFAFGGHSLKASLLASRLQREFSIRVPLEEIFKQPTIRQLGEYIRTVGRDRYEEYETIPWAESKDFYELSSVQQRMAALSRLDPQSTAYNVSAVMEVQGPLDNEKIAGFQWAFRQLSHRHESLRTSFVMIAGKPMQKIHHQVEFEIEYYDSGKQGDRERGVLLKDSEGSESASGKSSSLPISLFASLPESSQRFPLPLSPALPESSQRFPVSLSPSLPEHFKAFIRPFDISRAPLMRVGLVKMAENLHLLILDMHHMITDGFSMDIFIREFTALCRGEALPPLKKQYKDFSQWQYSCLQSGKLAPQENYWLGQFSGEVPVLDLLTDYPRQPVQSFAGERIYFVLADSLGHKIKRLARETGTTLFMVLLAALNTLLSRYTGQEDIIIGTTVAGRRHPDLENIMGVFIETLALRTAPVGDKTFAAFLQEVKTQTLAAYENEAYPFRELIKKTGGDAGMSQNPLFNVMLIVQNVDIADLELKGLRFSPYPYYSKVAKLDITLEAVESDRGIQCHIEYCTDLFKAETMERFKGHLLNILREVTNNPQQELAKIEILDPREKDRLLKEFKECHWTPDPQTFPGNIRLEKLFEQQVAGTPDRIALVAGQQRFAYLTYRQLNEQANEIAKRIEEL